MLEITLRAGLTDSADRHSSRYLDMITLLLGLLRDLLRPNSDLIIENPALRQPSRGYQSDRPSTKPLPSDQRRQKESPGRKRPGLRNRTVST